MKWFITEGHRHMLLVPNLNLRFQYLPLLHIIILIICDFFHKISWEMHVQNHANTWFFFIPNRTLFLKTPKLIDVSFCFNSSEFKSMTWT